MVVMRLYGSIIALVSGTYSIYLATAGVRMSGSAWFMLGLGIIVLVHGILLLTSFSLRFRTGGGGTMIGYAVLMLLNQVWMVTIGTADVMGMTVGWDAGMIALAVLMLGSGIIMTVRRDMMLATPDP